MITTVKKIKSIITFKFFMFFVLTAFMGTAQSGGTQSLELSDLDQTWFKIKKSSKGFCELDDRSLEKEKYKQKGYLFITSGEGQLSGAYVYLDDKVWKKVSDVNIELDLGTVDKGILEIYIEEDYDEFDYNYSYFTVSLVTKEKNGSLKSGKLKSMLGYEEEMSEHGDCVYAAKLSGKTVPLKKVPEDVQSIILGD